jgi:hypothetical protein
MFWLGVVAGVVGTVVLVGGCVLYQFSKPEMWQ